MRRLTLSLIPLLFAACASTNKNHVEQAVSPQLAPEALMLESLAGNDVDLNQVLADGKPVAFVFWQTWCAPCIAHAPQVGEAARTLADDVQFVGVIPGPSESIDDQKARIIAAGKRMEFPHVRDSSLTLSRAFNVQGTPTIVVLRADGTTGYRGSGLPADLSNLR